MKTKDTGKVDHRKASWKRIVVQLFLGCLVILLLASIPLLSLVAVFATISAAIHRIGDFLSSGLSTFVMASLTWMAELVAYAIWLLLVGDYAQLIRLIAELIEAVRSACVL